MEPPRHIPKVGNFLIASDAQGAHFVVIHLEHLE